MISCRDHHCFSNTVIGWSFRVCLGAEELEQWYGDRRDFLANLPTHATRASRSPRFRPCSPDIRKKSRLFCRLRICLHPFANSIFAEFLLTLSCVLIWSRNMVNPTELSLSLLKNKLIKEFLTKRQDKQRIRKPADFTRSPR